MNETIIILGIVLSILFYEITEMSPGGLIVPGYFALFLNDPKRIAMTLVVVMIGIAIVRIIENYTILFGRRKFAIYIIITFLVKVFFQSLNLEILIGGEVIGILIPAILAQDIERNGAKKTIPALIILSITIKSIYVLSEVIL
ncbi:poly-gamma-glutamate biosynthesis protein PgsC [Fusobacterium sp. MFO224]|uniref:poly-gamma-glutamate biosynthesis protein PgsC n=1 Tax=Fusobacterium sp. MFO224 TaxID=3378070 RepID=UPI0038524EAA